MRFKTSVLRTVVSFSLSLALCAAASAETFEVKQGEPAPVDGVLFDTDAAKQAAQDIPAVKNLRAQTETLKAEVAQLQAQVQAQKDELAADREALKKAEEKARITDESAERLAKAVEMNERSMALAERAGTLAIKAAEQSNAALEKMQSKLDAANARGFWGTLAALVLGLFGGAAF